jgi:hypothetical protein
MAMSAARVGRWPFLANVLMALIFFALLGRYCQIPSTASAFTYQQWLGTFAGANTVWAEKQIINTKRDRAITSTPPCGSGLVEYCLGQGLPVVRGD